MSDAPSANPLGAGSDIITATEKISHLLSPESTDQPEQEAATDSANQAESEPVYDEATGRYRDPSTNKFVKGPEQETAEGEEPSDEEAAEAEEADAGADPEEPDGEDLELADTVDGLAEQLGIDPSDFTSALKARVKINGEESEVTLSELVNGYQKDGDYRQKTAELSEQRRAVRDAEAEIAKKRDEFSSQLEPLIAQLKQYESIDEQFMNQLAAENRWDELAQYRYAADQRQKQLQQAEQEKQRIEQDKQAEQQKQHTARVAENNRLLEDLKPEWAKDPEKGRQEIAQVRQYMKSEGFDTALVDNLFDARIIAAMDKARKYDNLQRTAPEKLKVARAAPKRVLRPGPSKPKVDPKLKARRDNFNRLRQSGKPEDAAKIIATMI